MDLFQGEVHFARELRLRTDGGPVCGDGEIDYYENLYWCALLLYFVGDPADVPLMWEAKHIDMDTAFGFDTQFMFGAGVDATIAPPTQFSTILVLKVSRPPMLKH